MSVVDEMRQRHDSGGRNWELLDVRRYEIVQQLCGERGLALFSFLLESSTIEPGQEDSAICSLQCLRDVALRLGWSPDTVKRYIAVFRAVNLVHQYHDCWREGKVRLPLGSYAPLTNFTALDELLGKRQKQRQLALQVKTRYIMHYGDPTQDYPDEIRTKFQQLNAILESEHLEPLKRQRLHIQIADLLTSLVRKAENSSAGNVKLVLDDLEATPKRQGSGVPSREGDLNGASSVIWSTKGEGQWKQSVQGEDPNKEQGDLSTQDTISSRQARAQTEDLDRQQGDLFITSSSTLEQHAEQMGDLDQREEDSIPYLDGSSQMAQQEQGDVVQQNALSEQHNLQQSHNNSHLGDSKVQAMLKSGDVKLQAGDTDVDVLSTYNVTYLIDMITYNVQRKQAAQFLGKVLENDTSTFRKYLKLFNDYPSEIIGKAFLITLFLIHQKGWRVKRPGALFTSQCKGLSSQIPPKGFTFDDVECWLQKWGQLAYPELIIALTTPLVSSVHTPPKASTSKPVCPPSAFSVDPSLSVNRAFVVMSKGEAEDLIQRILMDERTKLFRAQRARVGEKEQGRYVVVVDASIPGGFLHQTIVYSGQDWQHRLATMKTWHNLFVLSPSFSNHRMQEA